MKARQTSPSKRVNGRPTENTNTPLINAFANRAATLIMNPPPSLMGYGKTFVRRVMLHPSKLKVHCVDLGCGVTRSIASNAFGQSVVGTAVGLELSAAASLTSAAQAQALGLLALRIPLRAAGAVLGEGPGMKALAELVTAYAARNAGAVAEMSKMSAAGQVATAGIKGTLVGAIATAAVQESISIAYYCHGGGTFDVLHHQTVTIGLSAASTVGGGTVGAAIGCLVLPGAGTAIGSLIGSYVGSFVPFVTRGNGYSHQHNEDPQKPSRKLKAVDVRPYSSRSFKGDTSEVGGGWLEVVDCSTESYFRLSEEPSSGGALDAPPQDSLALLRGISHRSFGGDTCASAHDSAMCGFGPASAPQAVPPQGKDLQQSSWSSFLNPSFLWGAPTATANPPTADAFSGHSATYFVESSADIVRPADDEMIIYFEQLPDDDASDAGNSTQNTFATCTSHRI